jgi:hypothetical protein
MKIWQEKNVLKLAEKFVVSVLVICTQLINLINGKIYIRNI